MKTTYLNTLVCFMLFFLTNLLIAQEAKKTITLYDMYKGKKLTQKTFTGFHPMNNGNHYCKLNASRDSLLVYDFRTGAVVDLLVPADQLIPSGSSEPLDMSDYILSPDETRILFPSDCEPIYRYSEKCNYYVYDLSEKLVTPLSLNGKQRVASFSPDGSYVAFVRENNIFMVDLESGEETQITVDGIMNEIINGVPDWVTEEEFGFLQAYQWSPDSKKIAYYQFDERMVKEYSLTTYGDLYPKQFTYKYPVPGGEKSIVRILVYDLDNQSIEPVDIGEDPKIYIPRIFWTPDPEVLGLYRMNRHQNRLELLLADLRTDQSRVIFTDTSRYYIEINDYLTFLRDGSGFILVSERDGYRHLYSYTIDGRLIRQLTSGSWEVTDVYGVDQENGWVYYQSTGISPLDRNVYRVNLKGSEKSGLTPKNGTNQASFSKDYSCFINTWSDLNTPPYITVHDADGREIRVVEDNHALKDEMTHYELGQFEFFSVITTDTLQLNGWMLKPPDFDPGKHYPVLFTVYGGPGSQTVLNSFNRSAFWYQLLAEHGIIVVSVDNRGTGGRGEAFRAMTYLQLGKYETLDMIEASKYLGSLPYIDKNRIGIWGWSYGGFMALSCLTKGAGTFTLGVAVAPVSYYASYDDIYTERYMRTPEENPEGYYDNAPVNFVDQLKGKLLIIHGMSDDNVHPQNSYDFIEAMVKADKQFEMQLYPNNEHSIRSGENTRFHLYTRMTKFILENL